MISIKRFPYLGAFESTKIHGSGTDILATTHHLRRWRKDLELLREAGLYDLRYPAPWHRIEQSPGKFDFSWMDKPMEYMRNYGMNPIIDLVHHTSFPDWLEGGFSNPAFPELFDRFVKCFAQRYDWVKDYTIFNEPLATTLLCSYTGTWYPHQSSDGSFVQMSYEVATAIRLASKTIQSVRPDFSFVYVDTCEHHKSLDKKSEPWVEFVNHRRFMLLDLISGRVTPHHPLTGYLMRHGIEEGDLQEFRDNPVQVDVLGLDYYPHSEMDWFWSARKGRADIRGPVSRPEGFANIAGQYIERYGKPVMLTETNIRGTVTDRITWLRFMQEQCELLCSRSSDLRGFCWYPSIDSTDWCHLCTRSTGTIDPQGIWYLEPRRKARCCSELSELYSKLARGLLTASDLPAYRLGRPVDRQLSGYLKLMSHWKEWLDPEPKEKAA